jgi:hypothetical protein
MNVFLPLVDSISLRIEPACTLKKLYGDKPRSIVIKKVGKGTSISGEARYKNQFGVNGTNRKNSK